MFGGISCSISVYLCFSFSILFYWPKAANIYFILIDSKSELDETPLIQVYTTGVHNNVVVRVAFRIIKSSRYIKYRKHVLTQGCV